MKALAISLLMALCISATPMHGQTENHEAEALIAQGDVLYKNKGGKREALEKYKAALDIQPDHVRANYMAGLCYLQTTQKSRSLNYFLKAQDIEPDFVPEMKLGLDLFPDLKFLIARAFQVGENYTRSNEYYKKFKESLENGSASRSSLINKAAAIRAADRRIFECLVADDLHQKPVDSRIENVKGINSPYPDYGPVFSPDGKTIYFTSRRAGGASKEVDDDLHFFEDIYTATKGENGKWGDVKLITELSTPGHESVLCISEDGSTLVISKGDGNGDLFTSKKRPDGTWDTPVSMGKNVNSSARETAAFLANHGNTLYFISDRSGGFGGGDIYMSERRSNGKWGSATNLGPKVNTIYDEDAPSVSIDGKLLYFSSKGHKTMGGFDIFVSKWDSINESYNIPENIGFPINSADDDNTYLRTPNDGIAYFASFKEDGTGDLDIYQLFSGTVVPDSVKKDREEFKELAKQNSPLMENQINVLGKDSSAIQAEEADRIAQKEEIMAEATSGEAPLIQAVEPVDVANSDLASLADPQAETEPEKPKKEFTATVYAAAPAEPLKVENGQGYFMFDPSKDMQPARNEKKETSVRVLILDTDTRIPLDGNIVFTDQDTKEKIEAIRVRNGVYEIMLSNNTAKDIMVSVEKEGFHFKNILINVPPASRTRPIYVTRNIELKKHTLNKPRILRNVYFDFDQDEISEKSNFELDMLYKMMAENEKLIIEVSGHADFLGDDQYNIDLSKKRAEKVVAYLTAKGIDKERLRAQGYGEYKPAPGTDASENGRALNRRTEFMIMAQ